MTPASDSPSVNSDSGSRTLGCAKCGASFGCSLNGGCWCDTEPYRLPLPTGGGDCLCPDCLRKLAQEQQQQQQ